MPKLILKQTQLHSLNDAENIDLAELNFDISQFNLPKLMIVQKEGVSGRVVKERNTVGELVETGKFNVFFSIYDRSFVELIIGNGGTEIGSPITVVVEDQINIPDLSHYEDGEFISITFTNLKVRPKKIEKKAFVGQGKPMATYWGFDDIKVIADSYVIGEANEAKAK